MSLYRKGIVYSWAADFLPIARGALADATIEKCFDQIYKFRHNALVNSRTNLNSQLGYARVRFHPACKPKGNHCTNRLHFRYLVAFSLHVF